MQSLSCTTIGLILLYIVLKIPHLTPVECSQIRKGFCAWILLCSLLATLPVHVILSVGLHVSIGGALRGERRNEKGRG